MRRNRRRRLIAWGVALYVLFLGGVLAGAYLFSEVDAPVVTVAK
jgi:hypothetical protein